MKSNYSESKVGSQVFHYNSSYFAKQIFDCDYLSIAEAIVQQYNPESVIEFGCGNGNISRALASIGVTVFALDGYADPDFHEFSNITFVKADFNDTEALGKQLKSMNKKFDVAVSLEVAEHLDPSVSDAFIDCITSVSDVVIFSAAVLEQGGDGHINCRPREYWHDQFTLKDFIVVDTIREQLKGKENVAIWYRLNTIDYVRKNTGLAMNHPEQLVRRLVASESEAASAFYNAQKKFERSQQLLLMQPMYTVFQIRNFLKQLIGRQPIKLD